MFDLRHDSLLFSQGWKEDRNLFHRTLSELEPRCPAYKIGKVEPVEVELEEMVDSQSIDSTKHMRVIIHPRLVLNDVGDRLALVKKWSTVFAQQHQFLVKEVVIYPSDLSRRSIVRNLAMAFLSFFGVDWHTEMIKYVYAIPHR